MTDVIEDQMGVPESPAPVTESHDVPVVQENAERQEANRAWAKMRVENRQLADELKAQREEFQRWKASQTPKEVDEFDSIGDEEYIPKGKVAKLVNKKAAHIAEEIAERKVNEMMERQHQSQFMDRLKRQYNDFADVVTPETLALLEEKNPELASTIAELKDPYKIGLQSYNYIKALNLAEKVGDSRRSKEVDKKLAENAKTVQSPQAYDKRPMAQAFRMTDAEKSAIYQEMMGFAQQAGGGF